MLRTLTPLLLIGSLAIAGAAEPFTAEERSWWAFQKVSDPVVPKLGSAAVRIHNPIDAFVGRKLLATGLEQAPEAGRSALVRRLYFDLIGLPPTPEELRQFLDDSSPDAYEKLVDRLLADPRYGERWAQHWLDLARYADTDGYKADGYRPHAWRYRDWVIKAFNDDKPYSEFVREQLAGDELSPGDPEALVATGFIRSGVYEYNNRDAEGQWELIGNEITDTVGDVFIGLGMQCARCHDHKFDPILQEDYYRLQAFFKPMLWRDEVPLLDAADREAYEAELAEWEAANRATIDELAAIERQPLKNAEARMVKMFPDEVQEMYRKSADQRSSYENQIADLVARQVAFEQEKLPSKIPKDKVERWNELRKVLKRAEDTKPAAPPIGRVVGEAPGEPPATLIPGDEDRGDITPGYLSILDPGVAKIAATDGSSGRRSALAAWLTRDDNPLTGRVIVNRVWQHHFGRGLVENASDFGSLGAPPTHPELLDWLTVRFVEGGWSIKTLHKMMVTSATYRQSSLVDASESARLQDPENKMLWKYPGRRLDASQIRDAMLVASGELKAKSGGTASSANEPVRTIYTKVMRNSPDPLLESFDAPGYFASESSRTTTTTATQSLLMINGAWTLARAGAMARRIDREAEGDFARAVERSYELCFGRSPSPQEREAGVAFIEDQLARTGVADRSSVAQMPDDAFLDSPEMARWDTAFNTGDRHPMNRLRLPAATGSMPEGDFTIEAIVYLRSMFRDATVRTIAARWNGDTKKRGWSFGVTSEKSRYLPRNLILQLVGDPRGGGGAPAYEVVASDLRIPLDKPYYVAASVDLENGTATFYARDLSNEDAELQTALIEHGIAGGCLTEGQALTIGAREDGRHPSNWDGLIDEVRLTRGTIGEPSQLLVNSPPKKIGAETLGYWGFSRVDEAGLLADRSPADNDLQPGYRTQGNSVRPHLLALTDYCHALLNSSEFLYVD